MGHLGAFLYNQKELFQTQSSRDLRVTNKSLSTIYSAPMKGQSFANLMTKMKVVIEDFFVHQEIDKSPDLYEVLKMKALARKGLSTQYISNANESEMLQSEDISIWKDLYALLIYHYEYYYNLYPDPKVNKVTFTNIILRFKAMTSKLAQMYTVELTNRQELLKEAYNDEIIEFLDFHSEIDSNFEPIAKQLIDIITIKDEESYAQLKKILLNSNNLSLEIRYAIITYITSYLNNRIIEKKQAKGTEILELYQFGLNNDILIYGEKLPFNIFLNLIGVGCKLEQYDWVSGLVNNYSIKVDPQNEDKIKLLGHAYLSYYNKDYEATLVSLRGYDHPSSKLQFRARWLQLTSNYELYKDDVYLMLSLIKSFENFLKSKKLSVTKTTVMGMKNTLFVMRKMLKPYKKKTILEIVEAKQNVFNRTWILSKI